MNIVMCQNDGKRWDDYVSRSEQATLYHLFGWKKVIEDTFGHKAFYLLAEENDQVKGILPLILMSNCILGTFTISLPFQCIGGVCADNPQVEGLLIDVAINITKENKSEYLELRQEKKIDRSDIHTKEHKATFVLPLGKDEETVFNTCFVKNLRNKIRKAVKEGVAVSHGKSVDDIRNFYKIFSRNMRDLGTPVLSEKMFHNIFQAFPEHARIFTARHQDRIIGCKFVMYFKDTMYFLWASSLRDSFALAPVSLLNWESIRLGCQDGYRFCDFGRSTINDGAYSYKKQYGGQERQLYWLYYLNTKQEMPSLSKDNLKYKMIINTWKKMPLFLTNFLGPKIVKYIP